MKVKIWGTEVEVGQLPTDLIEITEKFIEFLRETIGVPFRDIEYTLVPENFLRLHFPEPIEECYYNLDEKRNILFVWLNWNRITNIVQGTKDLACIPLNLLHFVFKYIALGILVEKAGKLRRRESPSSSEKEQATELATTFLSSLAGPSPEIKKVDAKVPSNLHRLKGGAPEHVRVKCPKRKMWVRFAYCMDCPMYCGISQDYRVLCTYEGD